MRNQLFLSLCGAAVMAAAAAQSASAAIVADFVADYQEPTPAAGWAYQWSASGNTNPSL